MTDIDLEHRPSAGRLSRDLVKASVTLSDKEARFLVDAYYIMQEDRKRANNQVRAMKTEPHLLIGWIAEQNETLESQIKRALESYSESHLIGQWMKSIYGIGPVIAAGMMAHIDITKSPTAGHIWRFAGYDPTVKWEKSQKRPWNAALKTLCWKVGQSFMKFSGSEECVYGTVYRERKAYEVARNDRGDNAELAARTLEARKFKKDTEAFKAYTIGKLPAGQIDARARRYAVKLFLSHLQLVWFWMHFQKLPAKPYALGHLDHTHFIDPPNVELVDGLLPALRAEGLMH
jgi:hypothetical protein